MGAFVLNESLNCKKYGPLWNILLMTKDQNDPGKRSWTVRSDFPDLAGSLPGLVKLS